MDIRKILKTLMLTVSIAVFLAINAEKEAKAGVQVDVSIGVPAPFLFPAPPPVVVIPGTYVYMVPDIDVDVLFYHGHWYRPHGHHWFRASHYDGPWVHVVPHRVPRALMKLPPHYHSVPPGHRRISHEHLKMNWGKWERGKHWNKDREWRAGLRRHEGNGGTKHKQVRDRQEHNGGRGKHGKN